MPAALHLPCSSNILIRTWTALMHSHNAPICCRTSPEDSVSTGRERERRGLTTVYFVVTDVFECIELFHGIRNDILCLSVCICISVRSISVYLWWSPGCQSRGFPTAICRLDDRINKASPPRRPIYIFVCQLQSPPGVCAGICACSFLHIYIISIVSCVFACIRGSSIRSGVELLLLLPTSAS